MFVYNPKTLYDAWPAFYAFIDFLIRMIDEDKVNVKKSSGGPAQFKIWLRESKNIKKESKVSFAYSPYKGIFVGIETPIRRFEFSLIGGVGVLFHAESRDPESYDKMLELFRALLRYMERHDPKYCQDVLKLVFETISSLDRKDWKKSKKEIEREFNKKWETRKAAEDFERQRTEELQISRI